MSASSIKVSRGCLGEDELAAVREVFAYGYFGHAHHVERFEAALREFLGAEHVVATNTGTSALHLALDASGIAPGDEVLVPSITFVASFQVVRATGATPVACDVEPATLHLDLLDAERRITERTRAIMPVDYAGQPCRLDAVFALAERYGLRVVEDAAHAFGATYAGRRLGTQAELTCFSFDSIKNITCGEGGAVVTASAELAADMRRKRTLGVQRPRSVNGHAPPRWLIEVTSQGFRYHMSDINAAIGLVQLSKVDAFVARRAAICRRYDQAFHSIVGLQPLEVDYASAAPHIYVLRVQDGRRDQLMDYLAEHRIETGINYVPNHLHPYFARGGVRLPETERAYADMLTLPLHYALSDADVEEVIGRVQECMGRSAR